MADVPLHPDAPPRRVRQPETPSPVVLIEQTEMGHESVETAAPEQEAASLVSESTPLEPVVLPTPVPAAAPVYVPKDPLTQEIENVLSEDLTDVFLSLSPEKRAIFKAKGEETASAIQKLLVNAHANAKKIFSLIRAWLKLLPGVNRFFLEQEAKIKTDKITRLS